MLLYTNCALQNEWGRKSSEVGPAKCQSIGSLVAAWSQPGTYANTVLQLCTAEACMVCRSGSHCALPVAGITVMITVGIIK